MGKLEKTIETATGKTMAEVGKMGALALATDAHTEAIRRVEPNARGRGKRGGRGGGRGRGGASGAARPGGAELVRAVEVILVSAAANHLTAEGPMTATSRMSQFAVFALKLAIKATFALTISALIATAEVIRLRDVGFFVVDQTVKEARRHGLQCELIPLPEQLVLVVVVPR